MPPGRIVAAAQLFLENGLSRVTHDTETTFGPPREIRTVFLMVALDHSFQGGRGRAPQLGVFAAKIAPRRPEGLC